MAGDKYVTSRVLAYWLSLSAILTNENVFQLFSFISGLNMSFLSYRVPLFRNEQQVNENGTHFDLSCFARGLVTTHGKKAITHFMFPHSVWQYIVDIMLLNTWDHVSYGRSSAVYSGNEILWVRCATLSGESPDNNIYY